jgi:hypothetical protein
MASELKPFSFEMVAGKKCLMYGSVQLRYFDDYVPDVLINDIVYRMNDAYLMGMNKVLDGIKKLVIEDINRSE